MTNVSHADRVELNLLVIQQRLRERARDLFNCETFAYTEYRMLQKLIMEIDMIFLMEPNVPRAENCLKAARELVRL